MSAVSGPTYLSAGFVWGGEGSPKVCVHQSAQDIDAKTYRTRLCNYLEGAAYDEYFSASTETVWLLCFPDDTRPEMKISAKKEWIAWRLAGKL